MIEIKEIFIIKKAWLDTLENEFSNAFGYNIIGFALTEEEAKRYCSKSEILTKENHPWPLRYCGDKKEYIYTRVKRIESD